ncbi:MAG TPA: serine hydrolase [Acidobacteria bacterium]|nr:serine hydrolase [Acidobacteriota bacterium]
MKKADLGWLLIISVTICLAAAGLAGSGLKSKSLTENQKLAKQESLDKYLSGLISKGEPGLAAAVLKNGQPAMIYTAGVVDVKSLQPITARSNFRLASVTKQFTATAIMLLARDGRLSYDQSLRDYFPDFPAYGQAMTIRQLLTHTSGLPEYEDLMPAADPAREIEEQQITDRQVLELLIQLKTGDFPPGEEWRYSNSGYVLLGLIIEKASGQPFDEFLHDRIFAPLGMEATILYERNKNTVQSRAYGHTRVSGRWQIKDQSLASATRGDGRIYSSVEDLIKWDQAWRDESLLTNDEKKLALTPVKVRGKGPVDPDGHPAAYGFGWFLNPWEGHPRAWHYGETTGFRTTIQRFYEDGLTVIILANRDDLDPSSLALRLARSFLSSKSR